MNVIEKFDEISKFSNSAAILYDKLAELEYNGLVGSKEYFECIDLIKCVRKYEDKRFDTIVFDTSFMQKYLEDLVVENNLCDTDMLYTFITPKDDNMGMIRLISRVSHLMAKRNETTVIEEIDPNELIQFKDGLQDSFGNTVEQVVDYDDEEEDYDDEEEDYDDEEEDYDDELDDDDDDLYEDIEDDAKKSLLKFEKKNNKIALLRHEILSHTYLSYLVDFIKNAKSNELKKALLKVKYRTICYNDALEEFFLDRAPEFLMPKLFQKQIENDINKMKKRYRDVYLRNIQIDMEATLNLLDEIKTDGLPLEYGGLQAIIECLYLKACNSVNPSYILEGEIEVLKQNAIKISKTDYAKEKIIDSFKLKKELTITKNVDL